MSHFRPSLLLGSTLVDHRKPNAEFCRLEERPSGGECENWELCQGLLGHESVGFVVA